MNIITTVLHCKKLKERYGHIHNELERCGINDFTLFTDYDADELDNDIINYLYEDNKDKFDQAALVTLQKHGHTGSIYKTLPLTSISLCIKHIHALSQFLETDYDTLILLEDDFYFVDTRVFDVIEDAPKDWDIIFLGGAFDHNILSIKLFRGDYILADHPATNTTSSMVYNRNSASKTLESIIPFHLPIDWQLNDVFYKNNFNVYHTYPYICGQLSNKPNGFKGSTKHD